MAKRCIKIFPGKPGRSLIFEFVLVFLAIASGAHAQDSIHVLSFPTDTPAIKVSELSFNTVVVKDLRSQTTVLYNAEKSTPHATVFTADTPFISKMSALFQRMLPVVKKMHNTLEVELLEFRVYNNTAYTYLDQYHKINSVDGQSVFKVACNLYLPTSGSDSLSRTFLGTMNRFYEFRGSKNIKRTVVPAMQEVLYAAADLTNPEKEKYKPRHRGVMPVLGDDLEKKFGTGSQVRNINVPANFDSAGKRLSPDSLRVFATYQDFVMGIYKTIPGQLMYDTTWKSYRIAKNVNLPGLYKPWAVESGNTAYIGFFKGFYSKLEYSESGLHFLVPNTLPTMPFLFAVIKAEKTRSFIVPPAAGGFLMVLTVAMVSSVARSVTEAALQSAFARAQIRKAEKPLSDQTYSVDISSGDILYN